MKLYSLIILTGLFVVGLMPTALAVPPPDFLFSVGASIMQAFSVIAIFTAAIFASIGQFAKTYFVNFKHRKMVWAAAALIVLVISWAGAYAYGQYQQQTAYDDWVTQSSQNREITLEDQQEDNPVQVEEDQSVEESIDLEDIKLIARDDDNSRFIKQYYQDLADGNFQEAYNVSKKSVPFETFKSWYVDLQSAEVQNYQQLGESSFTFNVLLTENGETTFYDVKMELNNTDLDNITIKSSTANEIQNYVVTSGDTESFFASNQHLSLSISNQELQSLLDAGEDVFILDARENEENNIGHFPGSTHIRFSDLSDGFWEQLPKDEVVHVFCWSGIRGKEVAEFLREKGILARYVADGAVSWVDSGHLWEGDIRFTNVHTEERYKVVFSYNQMLKHIEDGVFLVDSRPPDVYAADHIAGSVNIPIIFTPTSQLKEAFSQVPANSTIITLCDDFVSCFDAKLTGFELEKLGHSFLGRYNKPWNF